MTISDSRKDGTFGNEVHKRLDLGLPMAGAGMMEEGEEPAEA